MFNQISMRLWIISNKFKKKSILDCCVYDVKYIEAPGVTEVYDTRFYWFLL